MNSEYIAARVKRINEMSGDCEIAHEEEDALYREVLIAIAENRCDSPSACAKAALEASKLDFPRYYS